MQTLLGVETSLKGQKWIAAPVIERDAETISQRLGIDPTLGKLLAIRNQTFETADAFLDPSLKNLMPDPSGFRDMDKAIERIVKAMVNRESIAIYGDYDVDGASSVALFTRFLRAYGLQTVVHIPNRLTEGYGPNAPALQALRDQGATLCLMVDCGTTAFKALEDVQNIGLDVLVFDHHQAEQQLPPVHALVNPKRLDDESGLEILCAAGVVFMALVALNRALRDHPTLKGKINLLGMLDLVAVATVCDVVPLSGLNRAFVRQGLSVMAQRGNPGINALGDIAKLDQRPSAYHCGFVFGPRINAAGRLGQSSIGHELLSTDDPVIARELAMRLDSLNADRKMIEGDILAEAERQARRQADAGNNVLVLAGSDWHAGVTGIIASRVKDAHKRPAIVIALEETPEGTVVGTGSGRSVTGIDLGRLVTRARLDGLLLSGGGHAMAAGLKVSKANIEQFQMFLNVEAAKVDTSANALMKIDLVLGTSGASVELAELMQQLEPFGAGNREPRLVLNRAKVLFVDRMGDNHLRLTLGDDGPTRLRAAAFRIADTPMGQALFNGQGKYFHIAGTLRHDQWMSNKNGTPAVQFLIDDAAEA